MSTLNVFISYRRADCGWVAVRVADALRARLGAERVFLDSASIDLGVAFAGEILDAVRRADVLLALMGPSWDPDRLRDGSDWVRRELLLARELGVRIVPVLVDRPELPAADALPEELGFLPGLQRAWLRQTHPDDVEELAGRIAARPSAPGGGGPGRSEVEELVRRVLPPVQQWGGNRGRLVNLALAVLRPGDRLRYLAPARFDGGPAGSATALVTGTHLLVVEVGEDFLIRGEVGVPLDRVRRVEVVPTLPLFADVVVHTAAADAVTLRGLFRDQAQRLADHVRQDG